MKQRYNDTHDFLVEQEEESHHLKKWLVRMLRSWPLFLVCMLACLLAAYFYLSLANPVYQAVASLMVKDKTKELVDNSRLEDVGLSSSSKLVVNVIEILKSYDLMEAVVDSMQLFVSVKRVESLKDVPVFGDEIPFIIEILNPGEIVNTRHWTVTDSADVVLFEGENNKSPVPIRYGQIHKDGGIRLRFLAGVKYPDQTAYKKDMTNATYKVMIQPHGKTLIEYSAKLLAEPANKSATVINLEFKDNNKKKVAAILNALLTIYSQQGLRNKNRATDNTINFLNDRLIAVASELREVEGTEEKFKSENKVTNLSNDADQFLAISQQVDAQKAQIQTQLNIIDILEKDLQLNQDNPQLVPSSLGLQDRSLNLLMEKHNDLVLQKERIVQKSGPKNPLLIDLQNQIKEIRSKLLTNVGNLKRSYTISLNDISRKDAELSSQIRNVPQLEKKLVQITRSKEVMEQLYTFLLQKREEAVVSRVSNIEDFQTIAKARDLGVISPKSNIIWGLAVFMGFMLPVVLISLKKFMNNKVGDVAEVEESTDVPMLGIISHVKKLRSSVVINSHSRSAVAEQIRNIRTSINFSKEAVKTILVTSFQSGDGKSFVSLNLAAGYALLKKKTVMLEFDLRRPHISKDLGLEGHEGITSILTNKSTIDNLLVEVEGYEGNLFLLPAGDLKSNPAELISGTNVHSLMQKLKTRFDYIIINTPPLSLVTDAALLQHYADLTLIVLRQDHTSREVYADLKHRVARYPDTPMYLLLNDVGKKNVYRSRYGYGRYAFGNENGYYHEEKS